MQARYVRFVVVKVLGNQPTFIYDLSGKPPPSGGGGSHLSLVRPVVARKILPRMSLLPNLSDVMMGACLGLHVEQVSPITAAKGEPSRPFGQPADTLLHDLQWTFRILIETSSTLTTAAHPSCTT